MAEYGRVYKDEVERARRFEIFKENIKFIEDFNNAGEYNYTLGVNQFTDLTHEEFLATYTGVEIPEPGFEESRTSIEYDDVNLQSVPSSVDWRAKGAVNSVKNQNPCGKKIFLTSHFSFILLFPLCTSLKLKGNGKIIFLASASHLFYLFFPFYIFFILE